MVFQTMLGTQKQNNNTTQQQNQSQQNTTQQAQQQQNTTQQAQQQQNTTQQAQQQQNQTQQQSVAQSTTAQQTQQPVVNVTAQQVEAAQNDAVSQQAALTSLQSKNQSQVKQEMGSLANTKGYLHDVDMKVTCSYGTKAKQDNARDVTNQNCMYTYCLQSGLDTKVKRRRLTAQSTTFSGTQLGDQLSKFLQNQVKYMQQLDKQLEEAAKAGTTTKYSDQIPHLNAGCEGQMGGQGLQQQECNQAMSLILTSFYRSTFVQASAKTGDNTKNEVDMSHQVIIQQATAAIVDQLKQQQESTTAQTELQTNVGKLLELSQQQMDALGAKIAQSSQKTFGNSTYNATTFQTQKSSYEKPASTSQAVSQTFKEADNFGNLLNQINTQESQVKQQIQNKLAADSQNQNSFSKSQVSQSLNQILLQIQQNLLLI